LHHRPPIALAVEKEGLPKAESTGRRAQYFIAAPTRNVRRYWFYLNKTGATLDLVGADSACCAKSNAIGRC
jgi:hypothetical protein